MSKQFYKHKLLLDEHIYPRSYLPLLNERFDLKHIKEDLHHEGMPDPKVYELAVLQNRIILTSNDKDFRPLMRDDYPGIIGIPETWDAHRIDTKLNALLTNHTSNHFCGRYIPLATAEPS